MKIRKIAAIGLSALMVMSFGGSAYAADFTDQEVASQAGESSSESNVYNGV